ncbi:MAG: rRNA maturation RNase YbeY [Alphaproteobacteria bacterium]|nr:rRNA maturation RNase YbeY [Alphaproteobacteria bacterium]MBU6472364.1 rRNA maturation RNase YbeY [Alphaproteobacteria bacterium]MDE2011938.1 rRNA maturation RNase YbeY [Alphaproteobacteria bacterium]MDE2072505.1 rRNA maturation RNase YbeY [Alphaproteobacteria bacterium]MDE2351124.1 rRNA maturation RNase YbeY [Alphaproteobacteria bacterium]
MTAARIEIVAEAPAWREAARELKPLLRKAARLALKRGGRSGAFTILLADDAALRRLNRQFRGKDQPTNVLSFPAAESAGGYLGDIAIADGVTAREAGEAGKTLCDHAVHLVVHGVLHLLGYDHQSAAEAKVMEPLETAILSELGIADPYQAKRA